MKKVVFFIGYLKKVIRISFPLKKWYTGLKEYLSSIFELA